MKNTAISWTDFTWNPWVGCQKVSQGCARCYMFRDQTKFGNDPTNVRRCQPATFNKPLKLKGNHMVFTCSYSDFFIAEADEWRADAWKIIKQTPHLTYQILTKRPERVAANLPADWGAGYPNVWIGVSAEDKENFERRVAILATRFPAQVKFISAEPLLGPLVDNGDSIMWATIWLQKTIDWVIVGGESGYLHNPDRPAEKMWMNKFTARPCEASWIEDIVDACVYAGVPVFVKQMGTVYANANGLQQKDGKDMDEFPFYLRVQEWPNYTPAPYEDAGK